VFTYLLNYCLHYDSFLPLVSFGVGIGHGVRRLGKKDSSLKSNPLRRRGKKCDASTWRRWRRRQKNILKSQWTFNKNSCDLFTAITCIKIAVAYLIISYKNWCVSSALRRQGLLIISSSPYRNQTDMNFEERKKHIKKLLKIPIRHWKIWSRNQKINYDAAETSSKNLEVNRKVEKFDAIDVGL